MTFYQHSREDVMWRGCTEGVDMSTRTLIFPDIDRVLALAPPHADDVTLAVTAVTRMFSTPELDTTARILIDFQVRSRDACSILTPW